MSRDQHEDLPGASERVRSFAYPERPGAAATAMLLVGLLCLLVGSATVAVSAGLRDLVAEALRATTGG